MQEKLMTIRVESELCANFNAASELDHRPAAQVLRELMRGYISQVHERTFLAPRYPTLPQISPAERQRREEAVHFAQVSVGLEGFEHSEQAQAHAQRFINGEIDLQAYLSPSYEEIHGR